MTWFCKQAAYKYIVDHVRVITKKDRCIRESILATDSAD
ncbi:unnamed protein product [Brassica rapa]|uniref:Uncharacterized protein n=2 Tax=Brassica TaxID=3705 RepID=A0A8D9FYS3_BRACM|nr:unnamed protein product [Brassica napus]CAG7862004.1 unnamed protein product [Brassica rapa]